MPGKFRDILSFISRLNTQKMGNGLKLVGSFYLSRLKRKPYVAGLPASISIEPTTSCNLRCPQCPSGLRSFSRPTGMIDPDVFKKAIDELSGVLCFLNFYFQGEPYLHPQFTEMVAYAESKGIYTATSTNAHYLTPQNAEKTVQSQLSRLVISLDGLDQDTYEKYRVGGSLDKVLSGIKNLVAAKKKLKSKKPYIIIQYLVMKHNENEARQVKKLVKELGANEARYKTVQIYDYENGSELLPENEHRSRYQKDSNGKYQIKNKLYNHCWKMWHSSVIAWDGRVVPCCFDKDAKYKLGSIADHSFADVWQGSAYQDFRKNLFISRKSIDICQNCTEGTKVWI